MDQQFINEEFNFKQLFALIKKSGFRILIFCLIAAFAMGVITIGVYFGMAGSTEVISSVIEYAYEGADEGFLPNSTERLNANRIKGISFIDAAMDVLENEGHILNTTATDISDNIAIDSIIPDNIAVKLEADPTLEYSPTKYKITLLNIKELHLGKQTAKRLLAEVINQYSEQFKRNYIKTDLLTTSTLNKIANKTLLGTSASQKDYLQICETISAELDDAVAILTNLKALDSSYRTFNDYMRILNNVKTTDLSWTEFFILNNGVSLNASILENYYKEQIDYLTKQKDGYEELATSLKTELDPNNYKFGSVEIITPEGGTTLIAETVSEEYSTTYLKMIDAITQANILATRIKVYGTYQERFKSNNPNNTAENRADAAKQLENIANSLLTDFEEINKAINEYTAATIGKAIIINVPASYVMNEGNTLMLLLVASLVVVILAGVAAVIVTNNAIKNPRSGSKKTATDEAL